MFVFHCETDMFYVCISFWAGDRVSTKSDVKKNVKKCFFIVKEMHELEVRHLLRAMLLGINTGRQSRPGLR